MRIALLGIGHESNTFSSVQANYARFESGGILRGEEIIQKHRDSLDTIAGFLEAAEIYNVDMVPLLYTWAEPFGTITKDAFERIVGEMLQLLKDNGPWDGVLLAQHGAAVSDEFLDADGEVAQRVRKLVGPTIPIGMALDLHANLSQKMLDNSTAIVLYRTNPHLDARPRAVECAEIIIRTIKGEVSPKQALETPPMLINIIKQFTDENPMHGIISNITTVMNRPQILSASIAAGFPYADVKEMGMGFLAISDGNQALATDAAKWLANQAWQIRHQFTGDIPSPHEALKRALESSEGPVVLMDVGDNIGGGSPADSTVLLAEAQRLGVTSYLQTLFDPQAVNACVDAGVGSNITLKVGAKTDTMHGSPVTVTGKVRLISEGKFEDPKPTHAGWKYFDGGITVVLETTDDHTLVLTSLRVGNTSIEQMYSLGIRPENMKVIAPKGVISPRPAYEPIASEVILANTTGVTTADLNFFEYKHRRRPLYPFEQEATYS